MKLTVFSRVWHRRLGAILALPFILAGLTAILLAHAKALNLRAIPADTALSWLPGYAQPSRSAPSTSPDPELRGYLTGVDGQILAASRSGLYQFATSAGELQVTAVVGIPPGEIRLLTATPAGVVALARGGLYRQDRNGWQLLLRGDIQGLSVGQDGTLTAALRDRGLLQSTDGGASWQTIALPAPLPATVEPLTLGRLVRDLHTGAALFGKKGEWLWIDLLGAILLFLGLSGATLWTHARLRRLAKSSPAPNAVAIPAIRS